MAWFYIMEIKAEWHHVLLLWLGCYLIGGIPFGYLVGKLHGKDIRKEGSGNIGATNVFRMIGKTWGIGVFVLDFLKAFLVLFFLQLELPLGGLDIGGWKIPVDLFLVIGGTFIVLGHNYTPFLGFKGGKGMATSAGFLLALMPWAFFFCLGTWGVVFLVTRYVSVASIMASVFLPLSAMFFYRESIWLIGVAIILGVMGVWRHRSNLVRLKKGEEYQFSFRSSDKATAEKMEKIEEKK